MEGEHTRWLMTAGHWIAYVTRVARAQRRMIYDLAFGIVTTCSWAWIDAFVIDAGPIRWAFAVHNAFGTALNVRITEILGYTRASASAVVLLAHGIRSARRRLARMRWFGFRFQRRGGRRKEQRRKVEKIEQKRTTTAI